MQERTMLLGMIAVSAGLHVLLKNDLVSWMPLPVVLAATFPYTLKRPLAWLIGLAVISELFTTFLFGIMTAVVFLPWAVRTFARKVDADVSFSFLGVLAATITGQVTIMAGLGALAAWPTIVASSLAVFLYSVIWSEMFPQL